MYKPSIATLLTFAFSGLWLILSRDYQLDGLATCFANINKRERERRSREGVEREKKVARNCFACLHQKNDSHSKSKLKLLLIESKQWNR